MYGPDDDTYTQLCNNFILQYLLLTFYLVVLQCLQDVDTFYYIVKFNPNKIFHLH